MGAPLPLDAVTFDFWETLVRSDKGAFRVARRAALAEELAAHGLPAELDAIDAAFEHAVSRFNASWEANEQFTGHHAAELILEHLGHDPSPQVRERLVESYLDAGAELPIPLTDHVADTLRSLREAGVRLGIICDVGLTPSRTLRRILDGHGVLELFDHWSFSDEVGFYKPDARIFHHALDGLGGVAPERAAHVGDLRRTDVAGARAMGIRSVRYSGANDDDPVHGPEADVVVTDHADLLAALGL